MAKSKVATRAKRRTAKLLQAQESKPDFQDVMEHFSHAISLVRVCHRSLEAQEQTVEIGDEQMVLGQAVEMLRLAYNELDMAVTHLSR